jgi:hypothetical protein
MNRHTEIKPGAYRALFLDALAKYRETADPAEIPVIDHYVRTLQNPDYKFGKMTYHGQKTYGPGELFFRS